MPVQTRNQIAQDPALLTRLLSGNTMLSYEDVDDGGHGTQYEYHAPDGRSFLWYPGNRAAVVGRWRVTTDAQGRVQRCYLYGMNTFNPVLKTRGGAWECRASVPLDVDSAFKGDLFGLGDGTVPFVMPADRIYWPADIQRRIGGAPKAIDTITNLGEL